MKSQHYWLAWHLYKLLLWYMSLYLRIFIKKQQQQQKIPCIFLPPLHSSHSANSFSLTHIYFKKEKHPLIPFLFFASFSTFYFFRKHWLLKIICCCCSLSRVWLCNPIDYSTPSFPVLLHLPDLLKLISTDWMMPSNHLFFSCPQYLPTSRSFPMHLLFASGDQSIGVSASVLPMNTQGWFPSGLAGLISQLSKGL